MDKIGYKDPKAGEGSAPTTFLSLGQRLLAKTVKRSGISVSVHGIAMNITSQTISGGSAWKSETRMCTNKSVNSSVDEVSFPDLVQSGSVESKKSRDDVKTEVEVVAAVVPTKPVEEKTRPVMNSFTYDYGDDKFLMPGLKGTIPLGYRNFIGKGVSKNPPPPPPPPQQQQQQPNKSPAKHEQRSNRGQRKPKVAGSPVPYASVPSEAVPDDISMSSPREANQPKEVPRESFERSNGRISLDRSPMRGGTERRPNQVQREPEYQKQRSYQQKQQSGRSPVVSNNIEPQEHVFERIPYDDHEAEEHVEGDKYIGGAGDHDDVRSREEEQLVEINTQKRGNRKYQRPAEAHHDVQVASNVTAPVATGVGKPKNMTVVDDTPMDTGRRRQPNSYHDRRQFDYERPPPQPRHPIVDDAPMDMGRRRQPNAYHERRQFDYERPPPQPRHPIVDDAPMDMGRRRQPNGYDRRPYDYESSARHCIDDDIPSDIDRRRMPNAYHERRAFEFDRPQQRHPTHPDDVLIDLGRRRQPSAYHDRRPFDYERPPPPRHPIEEEESRIDLWRRREPSVYNDRRPMVHQQRPRYPMEEPPIEMERHGHPHGYMDRHHPLPERSRHILHDEDVVKPSGGGGGGGSNSGTARPLQPNVHNEMREVKSERSSKIPMDEDDDVLVDHLMTNKTVRNAVAAPNARQRKAITENQKVTVDNAKPKKSGADKKVKGNAGKQIKPAAAMETENVPNDDGKSKKHVIEEDIPIDGGIKVETVLAKEKRPVVPSEQVKGTVDHDKDSMDHSNQDTPIAAGGKVKVDSKKQRKQKAHNEKRQADDKNQKKLATVVKKEASEEQSKATVDGKEAVSGSKKEKPVIDNKEPAEEQSKPINDSKKDTADTKVQQKPKVDNDRRQGDNKKQRKQKAQNEKRQGDADKSPTIGDQDARVDTDKPKEPTVDTEKVASDNKVKPKKQASNHEKHVGGDSKSPTVVERRAVDLGDPQTTTVEGGKDFVEVTEGEQKSSNQKKDGKAQKKDGPDNGRRYYQRRRNYNNQAKQANAQ